ncbi:MAG: alpha-amylase family glycosyl hydrolase [Clostridia bacterium]|nr:alpha-amylase family glycosyl hydrolase [Clostridia bacterium]
MENISFIISELKKKRDGFTGNYFIPEAWNTIGYGNYTTDEARKGQINVNPYDFIISCIEESILSNGESAECSNSEDEINLKKNTMYGMFPRMLTAWEHYDNGKICSGTFLKALCYLPYLRKLGVDIVYLLPIFEYSDRYKKGEIGSPYAIKNIYKLDRNLHDELLGEYDEALLDMQFKAFVEACRILGMKVMVDFVFRTVSRDNDLVIEHPDWFYWIDCKYNDTFSPPYVEKEKELTVLTDKTLKSLYTCSGINEYLSKFTYSPKDLDSQKWEELRESHKTTGKNILTLVEEMFGVTTTPGFPDVINDPQPPWSDVTYLKFYFDTHNDVKKYIKEGQPPYILQDGACLNVYQGEEANTELWDYVTGVIPYYQEKFGISGARIDMGHALPPALNKVIVEKAKAKNKNFILWSEDFFESNSQAAKDDGFHFITGVMWQDYKKFERPSFNKILMKRLLDAAIPVTGGLETPDTPRVCYVYNDKRKVELLLLLYWFMPNSVPFINNGLELMEIQPMNLGLDNTEQGKFVLDKDDPMYGKLAFFDNYCLHWTNSERKWMDETLTKAYKLRTKFIDVIAKDENYVRQPELEKNKKITSVCYFDKVLGKFVIFLANRNFDSGAKIDFKSLLPQEVMESKQNINVVYADGDFCNIEWGTDKVKLMSPGEVIIAYIEKI